VIPTIGGCGSTTVACNLAALLAQRSKTSLLDLDLIGGGVASYFDVRPRYTLSDVMESAEKVDKQLLDNALVIHQKSQLGILARPDLPEDTQRVNPAGIQRLFGVLGRMFDAIEYRGASQKGVETLAKYAGVPVFNGLTDEYHPTQMIADVMTMREHSDKPIPQIKYAFLGDTRNNMGHSLMIVGCLMGMDVRLCGPKSLWPSQEFVEIAKKLAAQYGATLTITDDPKKAVKDVDFIHTDVWVSMGEPKEVWKERIKLLLPYQVNAQLMKASGNPHVKFMHCLPAFHDTETTLGKQIAQDYGIKDGLEVTDEVFESEWNIAFEQAENRMHTIKAILVATLGD
jgi:ornithine carbamoyltransferase